MRIFDLKCLDGIQSIHKKENDEIEYLTYNSKDIKKNSLFFAIKGDNFDGNDFIEDVLKKGAVAVVSDLKECDQCIYVKNVREFMGFLASKFYGEPSKNLNLVGITGTNGKTTLTYILHSIFNLSGVIGTTGYLINNKLIKLSNTTPESIDLQYIYKRMFDMGIRYCFMEVSAHAISLKRIIGSVFKLKVFTNISQDHLDYYHTIDNYAKTKISFFNENDFRIVNMDDYYGKEIFKKNKTITYGFDTLCDIHPLKYELSVSKLKLDVLVFGEKYEIESSLIGKYNIYNIMASIGVSLYFGKEKAQIESGIKNLRGVSGRLEFFKNDGIIAVVDYAHTDDAMKNVLKTLREIVRNRLIVVFGAGGDRDITKRPKMGFIAKEYADVIFITSDNPRTEDPVKIIHDILKGINKKENVFIEKDREKAIKNALKYAVSGDIIAVLGKGHENYQIFKDKTIHFDDREIIKHYWHL